MKIIAQWYWDEWQIPPDYTVNRLSGKNSDDVIFQLILLRDNLPVATGGLYNKVGLLKKHRRFSRYNPWVSLLYTSNGNRNQGYGSLLLAKIELIAGEMAYRELYLHTFTAERLYLSNNWQPVARAPYKEHTTIVMRKEI